MTGDVAATSSVKQPELFASVGSGIRAVLQPVIVGLVTATAFIGLYVGLQRAPTLLNLPVAVAAGTASGAFTGPDADSVQVTPVASFSDGDQLLRSRSVDAVVQQQGDHLLVHVAGANGVAETAAVESLVRRAAEAANLQPVIIDLAPLSSFDSRGLASFYVCFGVTLTSFVTAQALTLSRPQVGLRQRLVALTAFAVLVGAIAAMLAGPVFGALTVPYPRLWVSVTLLSLASSLVTSALAVLLGSIGTSVAVLVLTTAGNATSGATIGVHLLPWWGQLMSTFLPPGASVRLVTDLGYFHAASVGVPVLVLVAWSVLGLVVMLAREAAASSHDGERFRGLRISGRFLGLRRQPGPS